MNLFILHTGWSVHAGISRLLRWIVRSVHFGYSRDNRDLLGVRFGELLGRRGVHVEKKAVGLLEDLLGNRCPTFTGCDPNLYHSHPEASDLQQHLVS